MTHAALMSPLSILAVFGDVQLGTTLQRSGIALVEKLRERGFEVIPARSVADGASAIWSDP